MKQKEIVRKQIKSAENETNTTSATDNGPNLPFML